MNQPTTFSERIRELRNHADLGLREAARLLGISPSYLSRLEAGEFKAPSGALLLQMARLYQSDIRALLDLAKSREAEVMAADAGVAPAVQAFYRVAHGQPPEIQEAMLRGALDALSMSEEQKRQIISQLRAMLSREHGRDLPRRASGDDGLFAFDIAPRFLSRQHLCHLARGVLSEVFGSAVPTPVAVETVVRRLDRNIILIVHDEMDGGRLRDGSPAVLGMSRWSRDGRRRELVINDELFDATDAPTRRRANFTIAHELFHCIEHLPLVQVRNPNISLGRKVGYVTLAPELAEARWYARRKDPKRLLTREDWREWQANEFAAELLMPSEILTPAFQELFGASRLQCERGSLSWFADQIARSRGTSGSAHATCLAEKFDVNPQAMAIRLMSLGLVVGQGVC